MAENDKIGRINTLIGEKNFLSAYLLIKDAAFPRDMQTEYMGKIVQELLNELGLSTGRRNREKVYFYRSLLIMICEDVPGLARIYKRELRSAQDTDSPFNLIRQIRNLTNTGDKSELQESIENTIEDISEKIEDTAENINEGRIDESVNDLFRLAGDGIRQGLESFNNFLKQLSGTDSGTVKRKENHEHTMRKVEPVEKDKTTEESPKEPEKKENDE
jgi:hypothetical protein